MGKQEKYRKPPEDNRDIFEKALDNALIIGAVGGTALGGAIGRAYGKRQGRLANKDYDYAHKEFLGLERSAKSRKDVLRAHMSDATKNGAVIGAVAGAGAGYTAGILPASSKKRRK